MFEIQNFNLQSFIDCANALVQADEVNNALWLLTDGLPGYYRDNPPQEIIELRNEILSRLATPLRYAELEKDYKAYPEGETYYAEHTLRGRLVVQEGLRLRDNGEMPYFIDLGPGDGFVSPSLNQNSVSHYYVPLRFSQAINDDFALHEQCKRSQLPKVFLALEIIEHLQSPWDLKAESLRFGLPDVIHISTPMYSFDKRDIVWQKERSLLGHLKTFTPKEFTELCVKLFPEYDIQFYASEVMQVRLVLKQTKYDFLKAPLQV